ncbi:MAG: benzoyl-CoA reductase, bzd-type, subunit N [Proteobacteria bacterium]|nr:benzoyl-CoA reductase, bzd-type, subunit N [Pseudomonadota bacterium]
MFTQFKDWYQNRHDYAKDWKARTGGKVMAYMCTYVPEEILYAADVLPVRVYGSHEASDLTEQHIFGMYCPFCRDCVAQVMEGRYDYADGVMIAQACLHMRQVYSSWEIHKPTEFMYYMPFPIAVESPHARPHLVAEYKTFIEAVEKWTGKKITIDDLDRGIEILNKNRELMRKVYELRLLDNPPLTGVECMHMTSSSQMVDKREHNQALEKLLKELPSRKTDRETGIRLMIVGSECDDIEFMDMVESLNSTFVADDHCTGSRAFWNSVEPEEDRLLAIAKRYLERPPCPTKDTTKNFVRFHHVMEMAKEAKVEGAVIIQQKFCDPHEIDIPLLRKRFEDNGIRTYFLELDVTVPIGQFKIRIEAFLEMLRADELPF